MPGDGPFFIMMALIFFVAFPTVLMVGIRWIKAANREARIGEGAPGGLRASELKGLIREAVEEATRPLQARIEELEAEARPPARLAAPAPRTLALPEADDDDVAEPARAPRTRTGA
ncbi:MAG TPA: hypothetical protein VK610_08225 [Rhodothermales bacterium]|nr:hypothetical protein [Rhodothermales bacterium]